MNLDPAEEVYGDIIHLPHHRSARREPMPRAERAAQFASFAALSGHGAAIRETARLTDSRLELADSAQAALDETLRYLRRNPSCAVSITWFVPDARKAGGSYNTTTACVRRVDDARRCLALEDGREIPLDAISELEI